MSPSVLRRISLLRRPSWRKGGPRSPQQESFVVVAEKHFIIDDESSRDYGLPVVREQSRATVTTTATPTFQVKRVDCYYSFWSRSWKYRTMTSKTSAEPLYASVVPIPLANDQWRNYALVLIRVVPRERYLEPTFKYVTDNPYVKTVCQDVIRSWPGISWDSNTLEIPPRVLITFYQRFCTYRDAIQLKPAERRTADENNLLASVSLIIDAVARDFGDTLKTLAGLLSKREITFDLLYALFVPGTLAVSQCSVTKLPRLFRTISVERSGPSYALQCESVDILDEPTLSSDEFEGYKRPAPGGNKLGRVKSTIVLESFPGTVPITELVAYPIAFHPNEARLREQVVLRGKKWLNLVGTHHMQYDGPAVVRSEAFPIIHNVKSRIMIDRASFRRYNPTHSFPLPSNGCQSGVQCGSAQYQQQSLSRRIRRNSDAILDISRSQAGTASKFRLPDEELLLTPSVVFGFSFSDKNWFEFNVNLVTEVEWNDDAFKNLVIPMEKKALLRSVVDAHHKGIGVDDFVKEKGQGLIVNLSGPPGVGKTFTAEATGEHVQKPLFVAGSGDLGTTPEVLESNLQRIFYLATKWKAIVLIDEADVFLEKRTHNDLRKNAMVAVFLRHIEYYRGILFLTTNRLSAIDEAFLSRVHVSMHFPELSEQSRQQVWAAFINKLGTKCSEDMTNNQISELAKRYTNGRQIKNAVRTAQSLAVAGGQKVKFAHFVEALDAMEGFTKGWGVTGTFSPAPPGYPVIYGL